ncbi:MAG: zinc ribbon domain-containing protein [Armatimonadetes bacterium]|nr:zinc ribbon domain-containing protein [Armatimonadota bacterium]
MPLYEYECAKCKERFTLLQGFSAAKTGYECPKCGMKETSRVWSSFAMAASSQPECAYRQAGCDSGG